MRRLSILLLLVFAFWGRAIADEGMWLPALVHRLNISEMQQMGLRLSAEEINSIHQSSLNE